MTLPSIYDVNLKNKRVLIREDFNVPLENGAISNDTRIQAALPTIHYVLEHGGAVMLMSHLGRPTEGEYCAEFSLAPIASRLTKLLGKEIRFIKDWFEGVVIEPGEVVLFENVRFLVGENADDDVLAKKMAMLCDVFVNDAFATAHRAQASTHGVAKYADVVCAGPLMMAEVEAIERALASPKRPLVAIVGGAKVSSKLTLLATLLDKVDQLLVGGGILNTFLKAAGFAIGKSLYEENLVNAAKELMQKANQVGKTIQLPTDVIVAKEFNKEAKAIHKAVSDVADDEMILDVGPDTAQHYAELITHANTLVWNGPIGVFEFDQFSQGTKIVALAIAESDAFSIAGGGDTMAAIDKYRISDRISYISTGGGAFLELLEGQQLPALAILVERGQGKGHQQ